MAVSLADIKTLREMTGAGMVDCKKALADTDGDIQKAVEILRQKGQAVAAKRADRAAAEGCVVSKSEGGFAAILALNCETDFVAKNEEFVALTNQLLNLGFDNRAKNLEELTALQLDGRSVAERVTELTGKTGEKIEISAYEVVEGTSTANYTHFNAKLASVVAFNQEVSEEVGKEIAMQIASMNPVAVNRASVAQSIIDSEIAVATEKTKQELVHKAVEAALSKAGLNPNLLDSEDHIASNITKGWLTEEEAEKGRAIIAQVSAEKAASLPAQMIENIVKGRLNKFFKDSCLMEQEYINDSKVSVGEFLNKTSKGLEAIAFKRVNLNAD